MRGLPTRRMNMEGNWNGVSGSNKYQYNSKELNSDFGLNWNDYGARFYTSDAPRWVNVDPLSELRANLSPYQYVQNNPINAIDPTGMLDQSFYGKDFKEEGEKFQEAAQNGDANKNSPRKSGSKLVPYGTRVYVNGKLMSETVEGYNLVADSNCGCGGTGEPPCIGVGAPGTGESFIPVWGSGRAAVNDFQNGNYGWGAWNTRSEERL